MRLGMWLKRFLSRSTGLDIYATKSYSQEGEDLILARIFSKQARGRYVDVGAHHPDRFSNTKLFYDRGWSGINIEPNPDSLPDFHASRPRDINLQLGVSDHSTELSYHCFDDPALNTFDPDMVRHRLEHTAYKVLRTIPIRVERLSTILEQHLRPGDTIDFLTIDVEGQDLAVLKSNDWDRFRPRWVLAEAIEQSLSGALRSDIARFMEARKYGLFAKTFNTLFFRDETTSGGDVPRPTPQSTPDLGSGKL